MTLDPTTLIFYLLDTVTLDVPVDVFVKEGGGVVGRVRALPRVGLECIRAHCVALLTCL